MTKGEEQTIRNIINRLREPNLGCSHSFQAENDVEALRTKYPDIQCASDIYLNTWLTGALECLLPEQRDVDLARRLSGR